MFIWYDGIANPCDVDIKSYLKTGNIFENDLSEVWQSEIYQKLRDDHLNNLRSKINPCNKCVVT